MRNYECELVTNKEVPAYVLKSIKRLNMNPMIKVPIRQNGMTSTGKRLCCHMNVEYLVRTYGGQRVTGFYLVSSPSGDLVSLLSHSVWKTPEGKLVDVTQREGSQHEDNPSVDKTICFFVPVTTNGRIILPSITFPTTALSRHRPMYEELTNKFSHEGDAKPLQNLKLKRIIRKVKCFGSYYNMSSSYWTDFKWFQTAT